MKMMRPLFRVILPVVVLFMFAHPLRSETPDPIKLDIPMAQLASGTESHPSPHLFSTLRAELESGLVGDVALLAAFLLFSRAIWLLIPMKPKVEQQVVVDEPPVEVPPLRPIPERITRY